MWVEGKVRASRSPSSDSEECEENIFVETDEEASGNDAECLCAVQGCILEQCFSTARPRPGTGPRPGAN